MVSFLKMSIYSVCIVSWFSLKHSRNVLFNSALCSRCSHVFQKYICIFIVENVHTHYQNLLGFTRKKSVCLVFGSKSTRCYSSNHTDKVVVLCLPVSLFFHTSYPSILKVVKITQQIKTTHLVHTQVSTSFCFMHEWGSKLNHCAILLVLSHTSN